jgi:hypothetical protein
MSSPYKTKTQKINNMEIKNFNIYNAAINDNNPTKDLRKKKLHKKTISCLNSLTKK